MAKSASQESEKQRLKREKKDRLIKRDLEKDRIKKVSSVKILHIQLSGKVDIVILTIQVITEIMKNDEIELFLTWSRDRYLCIYI